MQVFRRADLAAASRRRAPAEGLHTAVRAANGAPIMTADPWRADAFGALQMTDSIQINPYVSNEFDQLINWEEGPSYTPGMSIDSEKGNVNVLDYTPRGGELPIAKRPSRHSNAVDIPRMGERITLTNDAFAGVRESGMVSLQHIERHRDKALTDIQKDIAHSRGYQRAQALNGVIVDKHGNQVVNIHELLGTQQIVVDWDLTTDPDVNELMVELKQRCEDELGDFAPDDYSFLCGRDANAALRADASVKEAMKRYPELNVFQREDNRKGFLLASDVFVVSAGRSKLTPTVGFIDETANAGNPNGYAIGFLVPNAPGMAATVFGPSSMGPFIGNPLEFYASVERLKHDEGVEILGESYTLSYFRRPRAVIKVRIKYA